MFGVIMPLCNRMFCCIFGWYFYIEIRLKYEKKIFCCPAFSLSTPMVKTVLFVSCKSLFTVYSNVFVVYPCGKKLQNKTNLWWTQILEKKIRVTHRGLNTYLLSWSSSRVFEGLASEMGSRSSEDSFSWVVNSDIFWMTNCAWIAS